MSTKIYDGHKFKDSNKSLKEVRDVIYNIKEQAKKYYYEKYLKLIARDVINIYDDAMFIGRVQYGFNRALPKDKHDSSVSYITDVVEQTRGLVFLVMDSVERRAELFRDQSSRFHPYWEYDFHFTIAILPCNDDVFVIPFTEDHEVTKLLTSTGDIIEYPYWNNTDQPEDMTWEQWEARGKEWDEALPGIGIVSPCGFVMDIVTKTWDVCNRIRLREEDPRDDIEAIKHIPSVETRAKRVARELIGIQWEEENKEFVDECQKSGDMFKASREYSKYFKENDDLFKAKIEEVKDQLKQEFTEEDFQIHVEDFCKKFNIKPLEKKEEEAVTDE
jgi:hypothetical protein